MHVISWTASCVLLLAAAGSVAAAADAPEGPTVPAGYRVETIDIPDDITLEVGGLAFRDNGRLLIATRYGDVWDYFRGDWNRYADGLEEPLGVYIEPGSGDVYVAQKPGLTRLSDTNGDGRADLYRTVCPWPVSGNYHEYAFGPVRDAAGNFYVTLNLSAGDPGSVRGGSMGHAAPYRGWCVRITPDGEFVPFAPGLRSPAGIGMSPAGEIFVTDNQGDWVPTSWLNHIERGKFYGHPASLTDTDAFKGRDLDAVPIETFDDMRTLPAVWFPHNALAHSPGNPVFDTTGGAFGPFEGQVFLGDQTRSNIIRVSLEKVGGRYQGVAFNFIDGLKSGVIRLAFAPDGSLWAGQTDRGWGAVGGEPYALQRIVYDGQTIPFEIQTIQLTKDGFDIVFTRPIDPATVGGPGDYQISHWGYRYDEHYGSPRIDETGVVPAAVELLDDGRTVRLTLPGLETQQVYQVTAPAARGLDAAAPSTDTGYYTLIRPRQ